MWGKKQRGVLVSFFLSCDAYGNFHTLPIIYMTMSGEALVLSSRLMGPVDLGPLHPLIITAFTNGANTSQWDPQHTFTAKPT